MQFRLYIQPECNFQENFLNKMNKMANSFFCDGLFLHKSAQSIVIIYIIAVFFKKKN